MRLVDTLMVVKSGLRAHWCNLYIKLLSRNFSSSYLDLCRASSSGSCTAWTEKAGLAKNSLMMGQLSQDVRIIKKIKRRGGND